MDGMLHVYTGNGKGKTTAAIGLAIRALGAGLQVFLGQFVKGMPYSELKALELHERLTVRQYGRRCFIREGPKQKDLDLARQGLEEMGFVLKSGQYQLVIMDEASIATFYGLFTIEELLHAIEVRAREVEVVVTGRMAHPKLLEKANLVTNMEEIKHYYHNGVMARVGIEK